MLVCSLLTKSRRKKKLARDVINVHFCHTCRLVDDVTYTGARHKMAGLAVTRLATEFCLAKAATHSPVEVFCVADTDMSPSGQCGEAGHDPSAVEVVCDADTKVDVT